ncbi:uncharacterized protein LOC141617037 [Silene latifolia]|uniref:uncharacterized protein LOC141617037 n=1 Tax=Silene latifolia TaxID=37657 RepID=UPI003D76EDEC
MKKAFLEKYFPASRASQLKKEISNTEQRDCETMCEYLERFKKLYAICPYHGYTAQDLVMYFCGGLCMEDARTVSATCGGNIVNKRPPEAWTIIGELAESSRDFARKYVKRGVISVGSSSSSSSNLEEKVDTLTSSQEEVNGVWESIPQKKWDPYSNTFNPGWKVHSNFRWGNSQNTQQFGQGGQSGQPKTQFIPRPQVQNLPPTQPPPSGQMSTEDIIRALVTSQATLQATVIQNQMENKAIIQNIKNQLGQMATTINRLEARDSNSKSPILHEEEEIVVYKGESVTPEPVIQASVTAEPILEADVPFPNTLKSTTRIENDKDIYETFRKCEVNIPFLDLLKSVARYAKFLKDLYTVKRQQRLKGNTRIERAMLDLGASINVIAYSLYKSMKLGSLVETGVVIKLADRSNAYPKGVVEDVLVTVDNLIFPADFYVLEMEHDKHAAPILLVRPFLKTASTKIDVSSGSLTMLSDGQVVKFNIYDSIKYPLDVDSLNFIDIIEPCVQDVFNISGVDDVQMVIENSIEKDGADIALSTNLQEVVADLSFYERNLISYEKAPLTLPMEKLLPSIVQAPKVELKPLP